MAVIEREVVFTSKDNSGNTVIQYPLTTVEQVDGGVASVNGIFPDADGNVEIDIGGFPIGFEYFQTNPKVQAGSLPLVGGIFIREIYSDLWEWVQKQSGYLITEAEWQALAEANGGAVPYYSDGDGSTTFRVPALTVWCKGAGSLEEIGDYLADSFASHKEEKIMKKSLVLAMAMALGVTASAYAANPFSDVPAGHWAYDSVAKLAAAGVVDGYADGAFAGDKLITRYEMAQIVAKAMAKGADCDKLAAEFADELDTLGVRVAKLEKGADNVKITGNIRAHYADYDNGKSKTAEHKLRSRIWIKGQVNDDWSYTSMIEHNNVWDDNDHEEGDTKFQRAYVNGQVGGMKVQAGRYDNAIMEGNIYHSRFDGIQADYGKDVKVRLAYGKALPSSFARGDADEVKYAEVSTKSGLVSLTAGYYDVQDMAIYDGGTDKDGNKTKGALEENKLWALNASMPLSKDLKLSALYVKSDVDQIWGYDVDDDGYVVTLAYKGAKANKPGSWGLSAKLYDMGTTTYLDHTMNGKADSLAGFEGYGLFANYALAKNIVAQVEYYDLEAKENNAEMETLWTQVVFTF